MTRTLLAALLLLACAASAQSDPTLSPTADRFESDLALLTRVASTAALAHDADDAFPSTTFGLLGSRWADQTDLRAVPFSALDVTRSGEGVELVYVPLPVDPYVRDDEVVTLTLMPEAGGRYRGDYQIVRRADPDEGDRSLPYDLADRYRVERAFGTLCVEAALIRGLIAESGFVPDPTRLSTEPLTVRIHPPGENEPVFFERTAPTL